MNRDSSATQKVMWAGAGLLIVMASAGIIDQITRRSVTGRVETVDIGSHRLLINHKSYSYNPEASPDLKAGQLVKLQFRRWPSSRAVIDIKQPHG